MDLISSMAVVAVSDLATSGEFYRRLLDRNPDQEPMPSLAQWDLPNGSALQVVEDPERAGGSMGTLVVRDVDAVVARMAELGLQSGKVVDGVLSRLVQVTDPDGNVIALVEPPR